MQMVKTHDPLVERISKALTNFTQWLDAYGEASWDFQSFFAGPVGRRAKALYYRNRFIGTAAVAPMVFCEAFLPGARRLFHHSSRFPIADAHYAMGFAFLYDSTNDPEHIEKAVHFLDVLKETRCHDFKEYCWGYPFDWVWHGGTIKQETPLITTTPYVYEAFLQIYEMCERKKPEDERLLEGNGGPQLPTLNSQPMLLEKEWKQILQSIARHARFDIKDTRTSDTSSSCSYTPYLPGVVINAAAYRAFLLTSASQLFAEPEYWRIAERNLNFVLENQNSDGSWYYAMDGVRDFVDHFHTCFVMKALAKIHAMTGHEGCNKALTRGVEYYLRNLFDEDGLPKPFSKAPRLTVYKRELYDCAECINLCLLLRDRFPELEKTLEKVVAHTLEAWVKRDGSFRSRKLHVGWDNVPMHRWGQSQMFRSLAFYLYEARRVTVDKSQARSVMDDQLLSVAPQPR
jgi:hypothetical protein